MQIVIGVFFVPAFILTIIAIWGSNRIDNRFYSISTDNNLDLKKSTNKKWSVARIAIRVFICVVLVFIVAMFIEWLIYTPPGLRRTNVYF